MYLDYVAVQMALPTPRQPAASRRIQSTRILGSMQFHCSTGHMEKMVTGRYWIDVVDSRNLCCSKLHAAGGQKCYILQNEILTCFEEHP